MRKIISAAAFEGRPAAWALQVSTGSWNYGADGRRQYVGGARPHCQKRVGSTRPHGHRRLIPNYFCSGSTEMHQFLHLGKSESDSILMQIAIFTPELNSKNTNDRITGLGKLAIILIPRDWI